MTPEPDPLEPLLDAAGRSTQPADPAWDHLPQRLAQTPQQRRRRRLWWLAPPAAAAAAAVVFLALWRFTPPVQADSPPIEVKRLDVDLTVLGAADQDEATLYMPLLRLGPFTVGGAPLTPRRTGQALVKDHRLILNLQKGDNVVRFSDVAATIDPTSVRFVSTTDPVGTQVIEQNFEYDLVNADALLHRYIDKEITCVGRDGRETTGYLTAHDPENVVLASAPPDPARQKPRETQVLPRRTLQAIRLKEVPADLLVKPTLVWKLHADKPGQHDTTVSYLCGFVKWSADYVALVTPGVAGQPDLLDLTGWVTLNNESGTTYEKAGLKLIAGDVNRVRDPWAPLLPQAWGHALPSSGPWGGRGGGVPKELVEKSFFEYHLYTLTAPTTVRDQETKQLKLLGQTGVKAQRRYVFDPYRDGSQNLAVELVARNEKENHLGVPLPKGRITFEEIDADGEAAVTGHTEIDHTPVKEELTLRHGHAFDVVGEFKQVDPTHFEMRLRNHKTTDVQVRAVGRIQLGQKVAESSLPFVMHDATTAHFDFPLRANAQQVIRYTIEGKPEIPGAIP
ncbi:MAG TPA: hypothetical protein VKA46_15150 [Gemmataceae bacterium]|nr:hypothetical protein [Gemmataceae bacterium]